MIIWEGVTYVSPKSARAADVNGHRLYVHRARPRARVFIGRIDGATVGSWATLDMAMAQTAKIARDLGLT